MRDEALQRDASGIAGVAIRIERAAISQRLVTRVQDLFTKKETAMAAGHEPLLDGSRRSINKYPTYPCRCIGHTETRGKSGRARWRCRRRARRPSTTALVARGVEARRLMPSGMGSDEPLEDNHSAAGRAKNNRVEIVFLLSSERGGTASPRASPGIGPGAAELRLRRPGRASLRSL